jgi:hypothetical protein
LGTLFSWILRHVVSQESHENTEGGEATDTNPKDKKRGNAQIVMVLVW